MGRIYYQEVSELIEDLSLIVSVEEFSTLLEYTAIAQDTGNGYWAKDNLISDDDVFSTKSEDATHVIWFDK